MSTDNKRTPDWLLERIALGELPQDQLKTAREQLQSEPDGPQRLQAIKDSNNKLLDDYPVRSVVAGIAERQQRAGTTARPIWSRLALASPIAAAAALVLWLGLPGKPGAPNHDIEITHSKGLQTHLLLYRQRKAKNPPQRLLNGDPAAAGDVLQLAYQLLVDTPTGKKPKIFGAIFSLDGRGQWTRHLPAASQQATQSPPLKIARKVPLDQAYSLDDAPNFECFYLLSGGHTFALDTALRQLQQKINPHNVRTTKLNTLDLGGQKIDLHSLCLAKTKTK